jgi:ubiquinone/menaquinone biosynthesis C-methylase UbiE
MARFAREFRITPETSILDVGGLPDTWRMLDERPRVTLLNMPRTRDEVATPGRIVYADGRALPFADQSFDIVFSNSVIEHVGDRDSQTRFAREVARVGRSYWVQTPNRWFPVEQHLLTPFIHWLPKAWQRAIVPYATVWGAVARVTAEQRNFYLEHFLRDIRLLTAADFQALFADARIIRERLAGVTKSLIAVRRT